MTTRTATKTRKSKTPLLDAALANNPHKTGNGWDKQAAASLAMEAAEQTSPDMPLIDFLNLAKKYKDVAGWKNVLLAAAYKHGVNDAGAAKFKAE